MKYHNFYSMTDVIGHHSSKIYIVRRHDTSFLIESGDWAVEG